MGKKRWGIMLAATLIQNANFKGFFTGQIYQGATKTVCVPGLNCYSCPGAVGACPIGSLQAQLTQRHFRFPYYVVGLLVFFGALLGRAVCGFLCPFGFLQELLHKIPFFKKIRNWPGDKALRYLKYVVLVVLVLALPIIFKLTPFFCKYLCPSGTLSGILLFLTNTPIRALLGGLFLWKAIILAIIVIASLIIWRPFCKYLCPLGAIYALFNKVSVFHMTLDEEKCTGCKACAAACRMCVDPSVSPNSAECIRCGDCVTRCPETALSTTWGFGKNTAIDRSEFE